MTLPSTNLSMSDVASEIGITSSGINLNQQNVRRLSGDISGASTMADLRGKTWRLNLAGVQSAASCYSAQGGFAVSRYDTTGDVILTLGVWPTDPPNCQTCSWTWLLYGASENSSRASSNSRPYWTQTWNVNITSMSIGQTIYTRAPSWPYTLVSYTYAVTKTASNAVSIVPYPSAWGTGDTGTTISVGNWWNNVVYLGGGSPPSKGNPGSLGSINLSWTNLGY